MTTLADKSLLSGGDNKPPMLEKHLYDSWKSRMELYMMNRPHGRMILASVEKGPLVWPSITEDGVTRLKEYVELTPAEAIQADCDIKAINIILQGLPTEIYALVSQHRVAKDLWEKIKLLMQGTSLTKQERECKLYDEFDKFTYKKGETLHEYYLRFTLLLNDKHLQMPLEQFFHLHAYLQQHERHANEVRLIMLRNSDPLALDASPRFTQSAYQLIPHSPPGRVIFAKQCTQPKEKDETCSRKSVVGSKASGQALTEEEIAFVADPRTSKIALMANLSRNGSDALTKVHNPDNLNYDLFNHIEQIMTSSKQSNDVNQTETKITSDSNIIPYSQYLSETQQETVQNSNSFAQQDVLM
ncbi:hypothetical protein Tco_0862263 [Tanacetum coccineum]